MVSTAVGWRGLYPNGEGMAGDRLTLSDVQRLLSDPSTEQRTATAERLAAQFAQPAMTEAERRIAEEIFRIMARDAEVRVREALSRHLKESPDVPRDIALALASDVDSVAVPMLHYSDVLTDADLIEIVRSQGAAKQEAVAGRRGVSAAVSEALIETGNENAVGTLVANIQANIPEAALQRVIEIYGENPDIQGKLTVRPTLPLAVAERLMNRVSENLRQHLLQNHALSPELAGDLILQARERAVVGLASQASEAELERLARELERNGRLTPSIILRALCMGDLAFFEVGIARLARTPMLNARTLLYDGGTLGLKAIFDKSGLPATFLPAIQAAIKVSRELQYDGLENDRERYSRRMMELVLTQYGDLGVTFDTGDLEYLLGRLNRLAASPS